MNEFTRGVYFAIVMTIFGYAIYECGKANGRRETKRKMTFKEVPIIVVEKTK